MSVICHHTVDLMEGDIYFTERNGQNVNTKMRNGAIWYEKTENIQTATFKAKTSNCIHTAYPRGDYSPLIYSIAAVWENVPSDMCAQRRLKSAYASAQSDKSSLSAWRNLAIHHNVPSEVSDQTVPMRRLIWIFARSRCLKVRFLSLRFIWFYKWTAKDMVGVYGLKLYYCIKSSVARY